jgi:hypothetical protein
VYYLSSPKVDPHEAVEDLLAQRDYQSFSTVSAPPDGKAGPEVFPRHLKDLRAESYAPPGFDLVQRFGRGLGRTQAQALQESREALVMDFALPRERIWEGGRLACRLVSALARREEGIIWDEETREVFTPDAWDERRVRPWTDTIPDVSRHTVIHAYQDKEFVRAISLGMAKFALPDIVVEDFSWSSNRNMGHLINLTAQALAEGAEVQRGGRLKLRLSRRVSGKTGIPAIG